MCVLIKHNVPGALKTKIVSCLKYKFLPERRKTLSLVVVLIYIQQREILNVNHIDSNWGEKPIGLSEGSVWAWPGLGRENSVSCLGVE